MMREGLICMGKVYNPLSSSSACATECGLPPISSHTFHLNRPCWDLLQHQTLCKSMYVRVCQASGGCRYKSKYTGA